MSVMKKNKPEGSAKLKPTEKQWYEKLQIIVPIIVAIISGFF